jgi:hypothetical protein
MVSSKVLMNSVISTKNARFAGADFINMYHVTPLDWNEYTRMPIALLPTNIIENHNLCERVINGYVYMDIRKGM